MILIKRANETLFYRILIDNIQSITPIIYTPVVAEACLKYSDDFVFGDGLYLDITMKDSLVTILAKEKYNKVCTHNQY